MANRTKLLRLSLITVLICNISDAITTWLAVDVLGPKYLGIGLEAEANPIMRWFLELGPIPFFGFKVGVITCLILLALKQVKNGGFEVKNARWSVWFVYGMAIFYVLLAINGFVQLSYLLWLIK